MSAYRARRTAAEAERLVATAEAMVAAGAAALLVEAVPDEVSERIVAAVGLGAGEGGGVPDASARKASPQRRRGEDSRVPVIGCGAGPAPDGHVVVLHDLLGAERLATAPSRRRWRSWASGCRGPRKRGGSV